MSFQFMLMNFIFFVAYSLHALTGCSRCKDEVGFMLKHIYYSIGRMLRGKNKQK